MSRTECAVERQLSCEDTSADDASELAGVVARCFLVSATHAEEVEHGGLRLEDCAAPNGANFDRGHRDGDLKVAIDAGGSQFMFDLK
jgi:hypothetical protein